MTSSDSAGDVIGAGEEFELKTLRNRGRHKIFLGYAPGVGKTYTMLAEARRRRERGEDVVVGYVETHARKAIAELARDLPIIPRKTIVHRDKPFDEMDTDAVIARQPQVVLVDELAHTNIPGSRHAKRWQSVEEILGAGIDVISTLKVQHLESLNDAVLEITGVKVQETLPDSVFDRADEVVLVDLTATALLNRLRRGVVYDLDKIPGAMQNFFRRENLVALRELALRRIAEEVDESLESFLAEREADRPWATEDRIVACVKAGDVGKKLVRRAYRLSRRLQGRFWAVHVHTPGETLGGHKREMAELFELARQLGGEVAELSGDAEDRAILDFAKENRVTFLVIGQSKRSRLEELVKGSSLIAKVMREVDHIDVLVVADPSKAKGEIGET